MTVGLLSLLAVLVLAFLRVPLAFALLSVSLAGIGIVMGFDVARSLVPMTISEAVFSYELAVVPMFILMGNILARSGISDDLFRAANAFLGPVRGGLALSTMVTCAGFSAVCGSSLATAATMSKVAYPSMKRYGYSDQLASATIAAGGTLGILIPPSIILMIYGILTQTNIGDLFVAAVIPGILGLVMYLGVVYAIACISPQDAPRGERTTTAEKIRSLRGVWPFTLLFVVIIGGLYGRLFTATEAAGLGAGLALILSIAQRRMSWASFRQIFVETATTSVMLYSVLFGALLFAKLISFSGLGEGMLAATSSSTPRSAARAPPTRPSPTRTATASARRTCVTPPCASASPRSGSTRSPPTPRTTPPASPVRSPTSPPAWPSVPVVIDTNVFVAALRSAGGASRQGNRGGERNRGGTPISAEGGTRVVFGMALFAAAAAPTGDRRRGGFCRSAGRREGGGGRNARRVRDGLVRSGRSSYRA